MDQLKQVLDAARARLFVGRPRELGALSRWLRTPAAATEIFYLWGMGGIGKSALQAQMLRLAAEAGAVSVWMDGRASRSPPGFADYLRTSLSGQAALQACRREAPADWIDAAVAAGHRLVLGIDNCEELAQMEGWFREDFAARLPSRGACLIAASRQPPSAAWTADPAWTGRLHSLPLGPLSRGEAQEYLIRRGLPPGAETERLIRAAAGHPLALAVGAARLEQQTPGEPANLSHTISAALFREVAAPDLHPLLEGLALLPSAGQESLARLVGEPVSTDQYYALAGLSFIAPAAGALAMHDVARAHLLADLRQRAPSQYRTLRRRAVAALQADLDAARDAPDRRRVAAALLSLCRDALPAIPQGIDPTAAPDLEASACRPADRPTLHMLLDHWGVFPAGISDLTDEHRLLDELCDQLPESIRVVRAPEGTPLGLSANVLLYDEAAAILDRYRLGRLLLCGGLPGARCRRESADTYYAFLGGIQPHDPIYPPDQINGVLIHDFLARLGEGTRLLCMAPCPDVAAHLSRLGFRPVPGCSAHLEGTAWPFHVYALDMRQGDLSQWVVSFLNAMEGVASPVGGRAAGRLRLAPVVPVVIAELRAALGSLDSRPHLQASGLAARLGFSGSELQQKLRSLLTEIPPPPLSRDDQEVLRTAFTLGCDTSEAAAAKLHLSRATYYRKLSAALANLSEALLGSAAAN